MGQGGNVSNALGLLHCGYIYFLELQVLIGEGVKVNRTLLQRCNHSQPTKLVCDLLAVVFSRDELATHSLTGQRASSKEVVKPPLNTKKVNAIFGRYMCHIIY